jgi:hypothetical protein
MIKTFIDAFQFSIPTFDFGVVNTEFSITLPKLGSFVFTLFFRDTSWICYVTLPDDSIRYFGLYPNVVNWKCFTDFGIFLSSSDTEITQDNIQGQIIVVLVWQ